MVFYNNLDSGFVCDACNDNVSDYLTLTIYQHIVNRTSRQLGDLFIRVSSAYFCFVVDGSQLFIMGFFIAAVYTCAQCFQKMGEDIKNLVAFKTLTVYDLKYLQKVYDGHRQCQSAWKCLFSGSSHLAFQYNPESVLRNHFRARKWRAVHRRSGNRHVELRNPQRYFHLRHPFVHSPVLNRFGNRSACRSWSLFRRSAELHCLSRAGYSHAQGEIETTSCYFVEVLCHRKTLSNVLCVDNCDLHHYNFAVDSRRETCTAYLSLSLT